MDGFDHILNRKLQLGSHPFPGKDGGTCINEAAIVAAGFEYQPVRRVEDMPDCFSRPICKLAMQLNDYASDAERQRLLPFVTRLACADTPAIELERAAYIRSKGVTAYSFEYGLKVLEGALAIGWQADTLGVEEARTRLEKVQSRASSAASVADSPIFAKVKSWLGGRSAPSLREERSAWSAEHLASARKSDRAQRLDLARYLGCCAITERGPPEGRQTADFVSPQCRYAG